MKKWVILEMRGVYMPRAGGGMSIDCTVRGMSVYADSDDYMALFQLYNELQRSDCYQNGVWKSYSLYKRAYAKRHLKAYERG